MTGPTPVQLLNQDSKAIYTWPQTTRNDMQLVALNGKINAPESWTLQSNLYVRGFQQRHVDGNDADVERCSTLSSSFGGKLCLSDDDLCRPAPGQTQSLSGISLSSFDANNNPITFQPDTPLRDPALTTNIDH